MRRCTSSLRKGELTDSLVKLNDYNIIALVGSLVCTSVFWFRIYCIKLQAGNKSYEPEKKNLLLCHRLDLSGNRLSDRIH